MVCVMKFSCIMPESPRVERERPLVFRINTKDVRSSKRLFSAALISSAFHLTQTYMKRPSDPSGEGGTSFALE